MLFSPTIETNLKTSRLFFLGLLTLSLFANLSFAQKSKFTSTTPQADLDFPFQMMWDDAVAASAKSHKPALVFDFDLVDTNSLLLAKHVVNSKPLQKYIRDHFEPAMNDFAVDPPMAVGLDSLRNLGWRLSGFEKNYLVPIRPTILVIGLDTNEIDRIIYPEKLDAKALKKQLGDILAGKGPLRSAITKFYRDTASVKSRYELIDVFEQHSKYDSVLKHLEVLVRSENPAVSRAATVRYSFLRMQVEGNIEPLKVLLASLDQHAKADSDVYATGLTSLLDYYQKRKKVDSAAAYFDRIMAFTGRRDPDMLNDYAWMLANQSTQYQKALELIDEALKAKPSDANFFDTRALAYYNLDNKSAALESERQALKFAAKTERKYFEERLAFYEKSSKPNPADSKTGTSESTTQQNPVNH